MLQYLVFMKQYSKLCLGAPSADESRHNLKPLWLDPNVEDLYTQNVLLMQKETSPGELEFLLRFPFKAGLTSPLDFLSHQGWGGIKALSDKDEFKPLDSDMEGSAKRWKRNFVKEKLGSKYVEGRSIEFAKSYEESSPSTPVFFIHSPGVDLLNDVKALGKRLGFTIDSGTFHNVLLGQGQEEVAERALNVAAKEGHWVFRQNIHLVSRWLSTLDKKVEQNMTGSHESYRVYMSAEPAPCPEGHIIPQGLLENAINITNEPPTGMHANLHKALDLFSQETNY